MATYELYQGGARQQNTDWSIFPAFPFATTGPFSLAAASKLPVCFGGERTLDFGNDVALIKFVNNQIAASAPIATNDHLGASVIPAQSLFLGCWWSVNTVLAGGAFNINVRTANQTLLAAPQSTAALATGFAYYNGAQTLTGLNATVGNITLAQIGGALNHYFAAPDILDVVMTTVPGGGIGSLSITITPVFFNFQVGRT